MTITSKLRGTICGIVAAITYGTNPLGALYLYADGINANSVLFYRYTLAAITLAVILIVQRKSFAIKWKELKTVGLLGVLFATSSLTLFNSFHVMDAGIASTLLFVYPVMVAVLMAIFFGERLSLASMLSIFLALSGIALLYQGPDGTSLSLLGVLLVMASSLSYAIYIIVVNKAQLRMSALKLTFYVLLFCILTVIIYAQFDTLHPLQWLSTPRMWYSAWLLALLPMVISLVLMTIAVKEIGSTPTAIMGALEPITAVVIGVLLFGEQLTPRLIAGIILILIAVILIIIGNKINYIIRRKHHSKSSPTT